jgi:hypothetical protein
MYLWKYWRESRVILAWAVLLLFIFAVLIAKAVIKMDHSPGMHFNTADFPQFGGFFVAAFYIQAVVLAFFAWLMGGVGLGRNLGEESGSYLLTPPRRRSWFLWSDWACGMAELAAIVALSNLMVWLLAHHLMAKFHDPLHGHIAFQGAGTYLLSTVMGSIYVGVLLFCGLIFSVTYFSTIVLKHARGVILGAGLLVGYVGLGKLVQYYWPSIELPHLLTQLFLFEGRNPNGLSHSIVLSMAARVLVMLLFPVAAQLVLDRSDI